VCGMRQSINFIDARTRGLFVETVLMNPNYNYFMFARLVTERVCNGPRAVR
jgi:hypothetical protein